MNRAVAFDSASLELFGDPIPILPEIGLSVDFTFSSNGTLVRIPSGPTFNLLWVNRQGETEPGPEVKGTIPMPRFSPDGEHVILTQIKSGEFELWIYEIDRAVSTPFTFEGSNARAVWSPDGKQLAFGSSRDGGINIYWKFVDGSGEAEQLTKGENAQYPSSWSPDGKVLAFYESDAKSGFDIWVLPLGDEPQPFLKTQFMEWGPMFSPDGRWIAFTSNRSGSAEVYVTSYPEPGNLILVSTGGGSKPVWAPSGEELFYRSGDGMMVVPVQTEPTFRPQTGQLLFEWTPDPGGPVGFYDISPDGKRFVMGKMHTEELTELHVVLNWFEELNRLVPTDN